MRYIWDTDLSPKWHLWLGSLPTTYNILLLTKTKLIYIQCLPIYICLILYALYHFSPCMWCHLWLCTLFIFLMPLMLLTLLTTVTAIFSSSYQTILCLFYYNGVALYINIVIACFSLVVYISIILYHFSEFHILFLAHFLAFWIISKRFLLC